jgi:hypothetical protein
VAVIIFNRSSLSSPNLSSSSVGQNPVFVVLQSSMIDSSLMNPRGLGIEK